MSIDDEFPRSNEDERELYLEWLRFLRGAVLRNLEGLDDDQARWTPDGHLIPLIGIVNHLTQVERRWIDGGYHDAEVTRSEAEFRPDHLALESAVAAYRQREAATETAVRALPLTAPCRRRGFGEGNDLRWVLIHLINETARHVGHADATRELLDGTTGE
jgi:uncharacterized damage-inducible protein DinB